MSAAPAVAENIIAFARALRAAGLKLGPGSAVDAVEAVETAGFSTREDFYWTLHGVLVKRHEDDPVFDIVSEILSSGRTGLLYQDLVRDKKLALAAEADHGAVLTRFVSGLSDRDAMVLRELLGTDEQPAGGPAGPGE